MMKKYIVFLLTLLMLLSSAACGSMPQVAAPSGTAESTHPQINADGGFEVLFIDVGQADSMLVTCDGKTMLVDGGNVEDSSTVAAVLQKRGLTELDYVVCTHAHEDHCGGLSGALNICKASVVLCPVTEYESKAFENFVKYVKKQGKELTIPKAGDSFMLGSAEVTVVGPVKEYEDANETSIVLRIVYGETSFLLTGDAGRESESDILDAGYDVSATLLKVGHHGSGGSSTYPWLRAVAAQYGVICVGAENDYGHPHEDAMSRLRDADIEIYRTDLHGDISCTSDGKTLRFATQKSADSTQINPTAPEQTEQSYIGNVKSHVVHSAACASLPAEKNRVVFESMQEALDAGYTKCGQCQP